MSDGPTQMYHKECFEREIQETIDRLKEIASVIRYSKVCIPIQDAVKALEEYL